jgi:hypothetical protein
MDKVLLECDFCGINLLVQDEYYVDGVTKPHGYWANMCIGCHTRFGRGLGLGRGQKYKVTCLDSKLVSVKVGG